MNQNRTQFLMITALVLALATLLAGPAQARPSDVDARASVSSIELAEPSAIERLIRQEEARAHDPRLGIVETRSVHPNDRGGPQGVGQTTPRYEIPYLSQGQGVDPAVYGGMGVDVVASKSDNGFEWGNLGIGVATGFGMLLLGSTAVLVLHNRQRRSATFS
jgi:hypothetical protein